MKKKFEEEEYLQTQSWNRKEKESHLTLYILIAAFCFLLAWAMS